MNLYLKTALFSIIIVATTVLYLNYQTFKYQTPIMIESNTQKRVINSDYFDLDKILIPNTSATSIPINSLAAFLLAEMDDDEKTFLFLKKGLGKNPFLGFTEDQIAKYYLKINKVDSAYYYSSISLKKMPIKNHFQTYIRIAVEQNNIKKIDSIFSLIKSLGKADKDLYDYYLSNKFNLNSINNEFKKESSIAFKKFKDLKFNYFNQVSLAGKENIQSARIDFDKGVELFLDKKYDLAIKFFVKSVSQNPYEYSYSETLGGAYVANKEFKKAIKEIKKVATKFNLKDGKSEYLLGLAYNGLEKKDSSCFYLKISNSKKYNLAKFRLNEYCN